MFTVISDVVAGLAGEGCILMCELSDLNHSKPFGRVWNDSCDEGLTIVSTKTGRCVDYVMHNIVYSDNTGGDNEVVHYVFVPTPESLKMVPECRNTKLMIIND